jgi:hypothetical protein
MVTAPLARICSLAQHGDVGQHVGQRLRHAGGGHHGGRAAYPLRAMSQLAAADWCPARTPWAEKRARRAPPAARPAGNKANGIFHDGQAHRQQPRAGFPAGEWGDMACAAAGLGAGTGRSDQAASLAGIRAGGPRSEVASPSRPDRMQASSQNQWRCEAGAGVPMEGLNGAIRLPLRGQRRLGADRDGGPRTLLLPVELRPCDPRTREHQQLADCKGTVGGTRRAHAYNRAAFSQTRYRPHDDPAPHRTDNRARRAPARAPRGVAAAPASCWRSRCRRSRTSATTCKLAPDGRARAGRRADRAPALGHARRPPGPGGRRWPRPARKEPTP